MLTSCARAYDDAAICYIAGVSIIAIVMGLNLLEVLPLRLPSLDVDVRKLQAPPLLQVTAPGWTLFTAWVDIPSPIESLHPAFIHVSSWQMLHVSLLRWLRQLNSALCAVFTRLHDLMTALSATREVACPHCPAVCAHTNPDLHLRRSHPNLRKNITLPWRLVESSSVKPGDNISSSV